MSYNLYAEGELDMFAWSQISRRCDAVELFPICEAGLPDAIGIALPSSRVSDAALGEIERIVRQLWPARVFDLYTGQRIATDDDLRALRERIRPN